MLAPTSGESAPPGWRCEAQVESRMTSCTGMRCTPGSHGRRWPRTGAGPPCGRARSRFMSDRWSAAGGLGGQHLPVVVAHDGDVLGDAASAFPGGLDETRPRSGRCRRTPRRPRVGVQHHRGGLPAPALATTGPRSTGPRSSPASASAARRPLLGLLASPPGRSPGPVTRAIPRRPRVTR